MKLVLLMEPCDLYFICLDLCLVLCDVCLVLRMEARDVFLVGG